MRTLLQTIIFFVPLLVSSCDQEYLNPYDRECPPEIWTPDSLLATLSGNGVVLTWELTESHFDGFVLEKSTDSINWNPLINGLIDNTDRDYTDIIPSTLQQLYYRIFAKADKNTSDTCYSKVLKIPDGPIGGLVAYYPFNGNANDESGFGNNGTVYNATLTSDRFGSNNNAYSFNGSNQYISFLHTNIPAGNSERTLSLWFKSSSLTSSGDYGVFNWGTFATSERFGFVLLDSKPYFCGEGMYNPPGVGRYDLQGIGIVNDDKWHCVAITYDGVTVKMYIDLKINATGDKTLSTGTYSMVAGMSLLDHPRPTYFIGQIDDIRIYNRVLSDAEIQQLSNEDGYTAIKWSIFNPNLTFGSVYDIDGNSYKTIQIGTQTWMAQSLRITKFNDGTAIPPLPDDHTNWETPGYKVFTPEDIITFGIGYNWYTLNIAANGGRNVCPTGWHVPTDDEWMILENYLADNGYNYDGTIGGTNNYAEYGRNKIAKALGSASLLWTQSVVEGSIGNEDYPEKRNASGFSALPWMAGGSQSWGVYWTSTSALTTLAWDRLIFNCEPGSRRQANFKREPLFVRCVKD